MNSASATEPMPSQRGQDQQRDQRDEARHHEHVAVGEVHHADDAEHHRVADGDEPVDRAERDAVDELLDEDFHAPAAPAGAPLVIPAPPSAVVAKRLEFKVLTGGRGSGNGAARRVPQQIGSPRPTLLSCWPMEANTELFIRIGAALSVFAAMALWEVLSPRRAMLVGRARALAEQSRHSGARRAAGAPAHSGRGGRRGGDRARNAAGAS